MAETEMKPLDRWAQFVQEATRIFKGFSMALDAKKLVFALAAVILWALGAMFINVVPLLAVLIGAAVVGTGMIFIIFAKTDTEIASKNFLLTLAGSLLVLWAVILVLYFATGDNEHIKEVTKRSVCQPLWALAVLSLFGTAICRIAAINATTEDSIGFRDALRFGLKKLATSVWTLVVPVAAVFAYGVFLVVVGILGRIPGFGHVWYAIIGLVYILFLLGGLFFALVLLIYVPGLALFQPAIAAEGSDSFDAISRTYSYIYGRPWRFVFYGISAYLYGRVVTSVAAWLVIRAGWITNSALARGIGSKMADKVNKLDLGTILGGSFFTADGPGMRAFGHIINGRVHESFQGVGFGGWFIVFWQYVLLALFMAFVVSLFYSLATQVYLLMRKASDGTAFEEVYIEQPEEEEFAQEFAEAAKPVEVKATSPAEKAKKEATEKAKAEEEKYKPIDLAGSDEDTGQ